VIRIDCDNNDSGTSPCAVNIVIGRPIKHPEDENYYHIMTINLTAKIDNWAQAIDKEKPIPHSIEKQTTFQKVRQKHLRKR